MNKNLLLSRTTALVLGLIIAIGARAADAYDFIEYNLQFVITGTNTVKVVGAAATDPAGHWAIPATISNAGVTYSVTEIGESAFRGCSALTSVTCLATTPPTITKENAFSSTTYSGATLYVPQGSLSAYQSADFWKNFTNMVEIEVIDFDTALNDTGGSIHFTSSGDHPWITLTEGDRTYAQSGNAGVANSTSTLTATVQVTVPSILSFDFKAWGEGNSYDKCIFAVDGTAQFTYGGLQNDWWTYPVKLSPGTHTLTWTYSKDSSVNPTGDYFAIDNVVINTDFSSILNVGNADIRFFNGNGVYPWIAVQDGNRIYARSGNAGVANSSSTLTADFEVDKPSILSFDFKAWGEGDNYDKCIFSIDGTPKFTYGARQNDWETYAVEIPAGYHTLTWTYSKDGSLNPTGDYFAIDNVAVNVKTVLRGDVNSDGNVDVSDATSMISYLLYNNDSGIDMGAMDVNLDNSVDVADATALINYLLKGTWPPTTFTVDGVSFKMIPVNAGTFMMGCRDGEESAGSYEKPLHQVTLSGFSIGETEVTQALWVAVMGTNPSGNTGDLNRPVENMTWDDCQTFITRLNQITGQTFRLPTEAEWEYAARGGQQSMGYIYAGSNNPDEVAWYASNANNTTHPVAQKKPNELGLYDMSGNVQEWCSDWYDSNYYQVSPSVNPTGPETGTYRVSRGGCYSNPNTYIRIAFRNNPTPNSKMNNRGLRLAM